VHDISQDVGGEMTDKPDQTIVWLREIAKNLHWVCIWLAFIAGALAGIAAFLAWRIAP
jgi:hypothetical protein